MLLLRFFLRFLGFIDTPTIVLEFGWLIGLFITICLAIATKGLLIELPVTFVLVFFLCIGTSTSALRAIHSRIAYKPKRKGLPTINIGNEPFYIVTDIEEEKEKRKNVN